MSIPNHIGDFTSYCSSRSVFISKTGMIFDAGSGNTREGLHNLFFM
jgi:hypothetical protein